MANTALMAVGTALVSAAVGVSVGIFIGKNLFEKKAQDAAEQEIQKMKKYYRDNTKNVSDVESDALELTKQEAKARKHYQEKYEEAHHALTNAAVEKQTLLNMMYKEGLDVKTLLEHIDDYKPETTPDDYATESEFGDPNEFIVIRDDESEESEEEPNDEPDDEPEVEVVEPDNLTGAEEPYIITDDVFDEEDDLFDKLSYNWYADDKVLSDETNTPFMGKKNYEKIVGSEFLDYISEETPIVYVRNERLMTDYEISYKPQKYGDSLA